VKKKENRCDPSFTGGKDTHMISEMALKQRFQREINDYKSNIYVSHL
jgi:hypothetical protein